MKVIILSNLTSAINVQVDSAIKKEATAILNDLGLSMSAAINLFLKQVVKRDGLPFEVVNPKPSKELRKALKEAEKIVKNPDKYPGYRDMDRLKEALLSDE